MRRSQASLLLILGVPGACSLWSGDGPECRPISELTALGGGLTEASGVAASRAHPGTYWVTNDSGEPEIWAMGADGVASAFVRVLRTLERDREDLALAACGETGGDCLYVADTGDNYARWDSAVVYRLPEPDPAVPDSVLPDGFFFRYPDGPPDVEALFVLPGERVHLVSKGRHGPVTVYRYPGALRADTTVTLEVVQRLTTSSRLLPRQITGADASADGATVVLRSYESLVFYRVVGDTLAEMDGGVVNLRTLRESQGEGVALGPDGVVALVGEAGPLGSVGSLVLLQCSVGGG